MKVRAFAGVFVFAAAIGLAPAASAQDGPKALDAAWMKAMKTGDANAVAALYAPEAVLWLPGAPEAQGAQAILAAYQGFLSTYTVTEVSLTDGHYETVQNVGTAWGHFMMTLTPKAGGAPTIMGGRFSSVAKKAGGHWRYLIDHASAEPPPPAPAAKK